MTAKLRLLKITTIEKEIGERAKAAKLKLRFDKVVHRLAGNLKATLAEIVPEGQSVVITVTAPIKHPAATAEMLRNIVRNGLTGDDFQKTIHGNHVRVRPITRVAKNMPKVLAFVHNMKSDAVVILDMAESRLHQKG